MSSGGQGLVVSTLGPGTINPDGTINAVALRSLLNDLRNGLITVWSSGNTASRPVDPILSQLYYDTQTVEYLYCSAVRNGAIPAQWIPFGTGGGGSGTVTSITATSPIVVTPDPITSTGTVSHANSGVSAATYGDATHFPVVTVNATGHVTSASEIALTATGTVTSISASAPISVSPNPITGVGSVSHDDTAVTPGTYGDSNNVAQVTVDQKGHVTAATNVLIDVTGWLFGSGRDGSLHFDGVNTFSFCDKVGNVYMPKRPIHATDVLIDSGVSVLTIDPASSGTKGGGQQMYCTGTLTVNGVLGGDGAPGGPVNPFTGGVSDPGVAGQYAFGSNGGAGGNPGNGANGTNLVAAFGGAGGAGGNSTGTGSHSGGAGGTVTAPADADAGGLNLLYNPLAVIFARLMLDQSPLWIQPSGGAGGGGGAGRDSVAQGGGGGGGGVPYAVLAKHIASGSGRISCNGGAGHAPGVDPSGGGGGGGGGGVLMIVTMTSNYASLVTTQANGGAGGVTGGTGANGSAGSAGRIIEIIIR